MTAPELARHIIRMADAPTVAALAALLAKLRALPDDGDAARLAGIVRQRMAMLAAERREDRAVRPAFRLPTRGVGSREDGGTHVLRSGPLFGNVNRRLACETQTSGSYSMRCLSSVTVSSLAVLLCAACEDAVTAPNERDPLGPQLSAVVLCSYAPLLPGSGADVNNKTCETSTALAPGNSVHIEALALKGHEDLTSSCTFSWKTNRNSVRVRISEPSNTAIVTKNPVSVSGGGITITATCNGVSGAFNIR